MLLAPVVVQVLEFIVKSGCSRLSYCFKMSAEKKITANNVTIISTASI